MSDSIIASMLAAAGLDTGDKIDGVQQPAEPVALGTDETGNSADAEADTETGDDDNAEAQSGDGDDANGAPSAEAGAGDSDGSADAEAEEDEEDDGCDESPDNPEEDDDYPAGGDGEDGDDNSADDGDSGDDDPAKAIVASFPVNDGEQGVEVIEVVDAASCLAPPSKATAAKEDRRLVELRGRGFTDEQLRAVGAVLTTASRRQRKLPVHAAVCSAIMRAYWGDRDRERREADCLKAIRNDGGQLGPLRYYESIIRKHDPLAAAKLLAEHHAERITAIRYIVAATINEARREDAIAKGVDPTTVKYLAVRTK